METTTIDFPTDLLAAAHLEPEDVRAELARSLLRQGRLTRFQAEAFAGKPLQPGEMIPDQAHSARIEMDSFIVWAAHDLKSPLNAVIGFTNVVLRGIDGPVNEVQAADLTTAHNNSRRMLVLTNNLIDMARINTGDLELELVEGDIFQTLANAARVWTSENPGKNLATEIRINAPVFAFDPARLPQVVSGLLTYAAHHVVDGGQVVLRAVDDERNFSFEIESRGEKAGVKHDMELVMLEFICRRLVEQHGGSLKIDAENETGLSLSFSLPRD